jgi:hypothetical protein
MDALNVYLVVPAASQRKNKQQGESMTDRVHNWIIGIVAGLLMFLLGAIIETMINVWAFKKYNICPYMEDKRKKGLTPGA